MKNAEKIRYIAPCEASILYNKKLNSTEKLLYVLIGTLSQKNGYCFAENSYLALILDKTPRYVQMALEKLKKEKYIFIEYNEEKNKRTIRTYQDICIDSKNHIIKNLELFDYDWLNEEN